MSQAKLTFLVCRSREKKGGKGGGKRLGLSSVYHHKLKPNDFRTGLTRKERRRGPMSTLSLWPENKECFTNKDARRGVRPASRRKLTTKQGEEEVEGSEKKNPL